MKLPRQGICVELPSGERFYAGPHLVAGWSCASCRIYNSLSRDACKKCGDFHLWGAEQLEAFIRVEAALGGDSAHTTRPNNMRALH
jgi:hypothetical protein